MKTLYPLANIFEYIDRGYTVSFMTQYIFIKMNRGPITVLRASPGRGPHPKRQFTDAKTENEASMTMTASNTLCMRCGLTSGIPYHTNFKCQCAEE